MATTYSAPYVVTEIDTSIATGETAAPNTVGTDGNDVLDGRVFETVTTTTTTTEDTYRTMTVTSSGKGENVVKEQLVSSTSSSSTDTVTTDIEIAKDQTFNGGAGDDHMIGGLGNDTFIFNFKIDYVDRFSSYDAINATPTQTTGSNTNGVWNSYLDGLNTWRAAMTAEHGSDLETNTSTQGYTYSSGKVLKTGSATFDNSFQWKEEHLSGQGVDMIKDFGIGNDTIFLHGLDSSNYSKFISSSIIDGNTVIHGIAGVADNFSITLVGVQDNLDNLISNGKVMLDSIMA